MTNAPAVTLNVQRFQLGALMEQSLYAAEASSLGIAPGAFPDVITADADGDYPITFLRAGRLTLAFDPANPDANTNRIGTHVDPDGDVIAVDYSSQLGTFVLRVYND